MQTRVHILVVVVLSLTLLSAARAERKEVIVALQPGFALMHLDGQTAYGGGGALDLSVGVSDALSVRATGVFTGHALGDTKTAPGGALLDYYAGLGLNYTIDLIRLVPYIDLSLGILGTVRPPDTTGLRHMSEDVGFEIGIGFDYLVNRYFAVGVIARYYAVITDPTDIPVYFFAGPRLAVHFGGPPPR